MHPLTFADQELANLRGKGLWRALRVLESPQGPRIRVDGQDLLNMSSNDYLGLANDPAMRAAAQAAVEAFGAGAGAVRTIAGTMEIHEALEREIAEWKGVEATLVLQSGFAANLGAVASLVGRDDVILSDELNHASIIDACRLSRATVRRFAHGDADSLRTELRQCDGYPRKLVVTDGVFSMDGDIAPLPDLVEVAEEFGAMVMVDDAHGSGVLGRGGRGTVDHFGLKGRVHVQMGTLSKAIADLARLLDPSRTAVPVFDLASAGRRGRHAGGHRDPYARAPAGGAALGERSLLQGRSGGPWAQYRAQRNTDHAGDRGRGGDRARVERPTAWSRDLRPKRRVSDGGARRRSSARDGECRAQPRRS